MSPKPNSIASSETVASRHLAVAAIICLGLQAPGVFAQGSSFGDQLLKQFGQVIQGAVQPKPQQQPPAVQPPAPPNQPAQRLSKRKAKQADADELLPSSPAVTQDQKAESSNGLPPDIKALLDRKYPGWVFGPVSKTIMDCQEPQINKRNPLLGVGDFNGDGKTDYAMGITHGGKFHALEFLSRGNSFSENLLFKRALRKGESVAVAVEKKGVRTGVGTIEKVDSVNFTNCEDVPARYVFRNGRVRDETRE